MIVKLEPLDSWGQAILRGFSKYSTTMECWIDDTLRGYVCQGPGRTWVAVHLGGQPSWHEPPVYFTSFRAALRSALFTGW